MDRALGARPVDLFFKTAVSIVKSNHNSVQVLFDEIASVYFISKIYLYFCIGNGQPREPALYQLYRQFGTLSFPIILCRG